MDTFTDPYVQGVMLGIALAVIVGGGALAVWLAWRSRRPSSLSLPPWERLHEGDTIHEGDHLRVRVSEIGAAAEVRHDHEHRRDFEVLHLQSVARARAEGRIP